MVKGFLLLIVLQFIILTTLQATNNLQAISNVAYYPVSENGRIVQVNSCQLKPPTTIGLQDLCIQRLCEGMSLSSNTSDWIHELQDADKKMSKLKPILDNFSNWLTTELKKMAEIKERNLKKIEAILLRLRSGEKLLSDAEKNQLQVMIFYSHLRRLYGKQGQKLQVAPETNNSLNGELLDHFNKFVSEIDKDPPIQWSVEEKLLSIYSAQGLNPFRAYQALQQYPDYKYKMEKLKRIRKTRIQQIKDSAFYQNHQAFFQLAEQATHRNEESEIQVVSDMMEIPLEVNLIYAMQDPEMTKVLNEGVKNIDWGEYFTVEHGKRRRELVRLQSEIQQFEKEGINSILNEMNFARLKNCTDIARQNIAFSPSRKQIEQFSGQFEELKSKFLQFLKNQFSQESYDQLKVRILNWQPNLPISKEGLINAYASILSEYKKDLEKYQKVNIESSEALFAIGHPLIPEFSLARDANEFVDVICTPFDIQAGPNGSVQTLTNIHTINSVSIRNTELGKIIASHEIGHQLSNVFRKLGVDSVDEINRVKLSDKTLKKYKAVRECLTEQYPQDFRDYYKATGKSKYYERKTALNTESNKTIEFTEFITVEEDFADTISAHLGYLPKDLCMTMSHYPASLQ
ncbi:MAG: hypothetical protein KDD40_01915, partial [Bdellovibrionales bacterium]|nr:hypothetical protein [Bdellovibrionales bacterium]